MMGDVFLKKRGSVWIWVTIGLVIIIAIGIASYNLFYKAAPLPKEEIPEEAITLKELDEILMLRPNLNVEEIEKLREECKRVLDLDMYCKLFEAIEKDDVTICEKVKATDPDIDKIAVSKCKTGYYLTTAILKNDASFCEKADVKQVMCKIIVTNDASLCQGMSIPDMKEERQEVLKDACVETEGFSKETIKHKDKAYVTDVITKIKAIKQRDEGLCNQLKELNTMNYVCLSIAKNDHTICNRVHDVCEDNYNSQMARVLIDLSYCEKINNPYQKASCLERTEKLLKVKKYL